mmetsp:Transcript_9553/g.14118  ORF Transcript_9553/g.14118 Transcript_9553/m.14118 type:complete len:389 (-) Transcript_9553:3559-4725(-)
MGQALGVVDEFDSSGKKHGFYGLVNHGNTCYCNAIIQSLYYTTTFRELMFDWHQILLAISSKKLSTPILSSLSQMFMDISNKGPGVGYFDPYRFVSSIRKHRLQFAGNHQHDSQEFLIDLFNQLELNMKDTVMYLSTLYKKSVELKKKYTHQLESETNEESKLEIHKNLEQLDQYKVRFEKGRALFKLYHDLFQGEMKTSIRCNTCEYESLRAETFLDLSLEIEINSSLRSCLSNCCGSEMMKGQNKFFCEQCQSRQEACRISKLGKLPSILIVHCKRFQYYRGEFRKHYGRVTFTEQMRFGGKYYKLYSIVIHVGASMHGGHYQALVKTNGSWILFDDQKVSKESKENIDQVFGLPLMLSAKANIKSPKTAYLLFYKAYNPIDNNKK